MHESCNNNDELQTVNENKKVDININSKKKKKSKKPAVKTKGVDNTRYRLLNSWPDTFHKECSFPSKPIDEVYTNNNFPLGEILDYSDKKQAEFTDDVYELRLQDLRRAAECHRQTRKFIQSYIQPGMRLIDICRALESESKRLISADGLKAGWAFPTGCSVNNVAAHYTPNSNDDLIITENDIVKFDFGVHVNGQIIDSAFTVAFDPKFDPLIQATQDGTNVGLKMAGIDAPFCDIGAAIQEAIESYEMTINSYSVPIKPISNLSGHSIEPYQIHGGKTVLITKNSSPERMLEGELYAIETFASTGRGYCTSNGECSHYMKNFEDRHVPLRLRSSKDLLHGINKNFKTLAFCRRWLDDLGFDRHVVALKSLVELGLVVAYPPLADIGGSFTSQMEHTVFLKSSAKEILSRGPDY